MCWLRDGAGGSRDLQSTGDNDAEQYGDSGERTEDVGILISAPKIWRCPSLRLNENVGMCAVCVPVIYPPASAERTGYWRQNL